MGRSLMAIAVAFVAIAALTLGTDVALRAAVPSLYEANGATFSAPVLLLMLAYVGMYAVGGCYLCAALAPSHPRVHAALLGMLGLGATVWASLRHWELRPTWYHIVSMALVLVYAGVGGQLRVMQLELQQPKRIGGARHA